MNDIPEWIREFAIETNAAVTVHKIKPKRNIWAFVLGLIIFVIIVIGVK